MLKKGGYTYVHEHLHLDLSPQKGALDCKLDQYQLIRDELCDLRAKGVVNIIEVTNFFMGRNPQFIERLMRDTGVNIVQCTGYYIEGFYPQWLASMTEQQIADQMIDELTNPIGNSSATAKVIGEIGSSKDQFTDTERKVFAAAAIAHKATGAPISTHTSFSTMARAQVELLGKKGVDLEKVVIGHCDLRNNLDEILWLIEQGCYVQFDTIGKNAYFPDQSRVEMLKALASRGLLDRVMLSMDITRRSHLKMNGGLGYAYLVDEFIPMLADAGITKQQVDLMLESNPQQFFGTL